MLLYFLQVLFQCPFLTETSGLPDCSSAVFCLSPPGAVPGENDCYRTHHLGCLAFKLLDGFGPWEARPGDEGQKERDVWVIFFPMSPISSLLCSGQGPISLGPQLPLGGIALILQLFPNPPTPNDTISSLCPSVLRVVMLFCCGSVPVDSLNPHHSSRCLTKLT